MIGGLVSLALATNVWITAVVAGATALMAWEWFDEAAGRALSAVVVAVVALAGFNLVLGVIWQPRIEVGLFLAVFVFGAVAMWHLRSQWALGWPIALGAGFALAGLVLIGGPLLVKHSAAKAAAKKVGSPSPVGSRLDILIVTDGSVHPQPIDLPSDAALQEFDVHFAVGVAEGNRVRWTFPDITDATQALKIAAAGASSPVDAGTHVARPDADQVMVLVADGSPLVTDRPQLLPEVTPSADPDHWERIVKSANVRGTPVFALLQTRADGSWRSGGTSSPAAAPARFRHSEARR